MKLMPDFFVTSLISALSVCWFTCLQLCKFQSSLRFGPVQPIGSKKTGPSPQKVGFLKSYVETSPAIKLSSSYKDMIPFQKRLSFYFYFLRLNLG